MDIYLVVDDMWINIPESQLCNYSRQDYLTAEEYKRVKEVVRSLDKKNLKHDSSYFNNMRYFIKEHINFTPVILRLKKKTEEKLQLF